MEDIKAVGFLKPKNLCERASEDEKSVQTHISCSPSSSLQPSPLAVSPNPLTPHVSYWAWSLSPFSRLPSFFFGVERISRVSPGFLGAQSVHTPFLAGNKFFCCNRS